MGDVHCLGGVASYALPCFRVHHCGLACETSKYKQRARAPVHCPGTGSTFKIRNAPSLNRSHCCVPARQPAADKRDGPRHPTRLRFGCAAPACLVPPRLRALLSASAEKPSSLHFSCTKTNCCRSATHCRSRLSRRSRSAASTSTAWSTAVHCATSGMYLPAGKFVRHGGAHLVHGC